MTTIAGSVSAIVPHYGDPSHALALVAQLGAQQGAPELEIIVVDDASAQPFPAVEGIHVVRRARNGGYGAAVNSGAAAATCPWLLILNSDLSVDRTFVADLTREAAPWQPAVVAPMLVGGTGRSQWAGRHFPKSRHYVVEWLTPLARFRERACMHEAVGHDTRCAAGAIVPVDWLVGAALLLPAEEFRAVGGFDESFHMNCEEVDLQRRLRDRGIPSVFVGTVSATHAGGASSESGRRRVWLVASRMRYARKWHAGPARLRAALTAASFVNAGANLVRRLAGRRTRPLATLRQELGFLRDGARQSG